MKVLIVNTYDIQGGAARAAYRLHKALLGQNIDSQMLVQSKSSDDFTVITKTSKLRKGLNNFVQLFIAYLFDFTKSGLKHFLALLGLVLAT